MTYLLDTSIISALMKEHPAAIARVERIASPDEAATCVVVRGEILHGLRRLAEGRKRQALVQKAASLFRMLTCHPISAEMADNYAELKSDCESQGVPMADNDLWIAATALHLDATLVSADRDFVRVNRLRVEDWTA